MRVCAAFIPDIMDVLVGVETGHTYADDMIAPCSASEEMFGVSWRWLNGYTSSPNATDVSSQPRSSIRKRMMLGFCSSVEQAARGAANAREARGLIFSFFISFLIDKLVWIWNRISCCSECRHQCFLFFELSGHCLCQFFKLFRIVLGKICLF